MPSKKQTILLIFLVFLIGGGFLLQNSIRDWLITESTDNAYIEADISYISPEISGVLKKLNVSENTLVKEGDILAEIEDNSYLAKFNQTNSELQITENKVFMTEYDIKLAGLNIQKLEESMAVLQNNFDIAENEYKRITSLNKSKFSSQKSLDTAKADFDKARYELKKNELDVESAQYALTSLNLRKSSETGQLAILGEALKIAEKNYKDTIIKAPIDGIVTNINSKPGSFLNVGRPLLAIVNKFNLYIKANFKETQIKNLKIGSKVVITVDAIKDRKFEGEIRSFSPATGSKFSLIPADNASGNFTKVVQRIPVIIDFKIPEEFKDFIIPGMSVTIRAY